MVNDSSTLGTDVMLHLALVVNDIEKTSQAYANFFRVEKPQWKLTKPSNESNTKFRGKETEARAKLAFIKTGSIVIELIEPDNNPSTWREVLDEKGEGFHHIAFKINNMQQIKSRMEECNMPLIQSGGYAGGQYAYMDCLEDLKLIIELLEDDVNQD
ncbi:VOC family protein [Aquibacillus halophilus]|uniref:VOC family protein n=1 Tax=Aquibacillus halophilus TaxID=930132 RepID=A0A6A8D7N1_9BACI|nr:VOC family protein [Aquibacillus halophilus]MRH41598.1 VOC family protein [Aquibacillus halophilus]